MTLPRIPLAPEGLIFILPLFFLAGLALIIDFWPVALFFLVLSGALIFFFRDPERKSPSCQNLLLAPADGRVLEIKRSGSLTTVAIFLSLLDVHVVRSPLAGTVVNILDQEGKTWPAYRKEAPRENRSKTLFFQNQEENLELRMIVGQLARRIRCYVRPGDLVSAGQRIGLMVFGSRVEISFGPEYSLKINPKEKTKAGVTVLAERKKE